MSWRSFRDSRCKISSGNKNFHTDAFTTSRRCFPDVLAKLQDASATFSRSIRYVFAKLGDNNMRSVKLREYIANASERHRRCIAKTSPMSTCENFQCKHELLTMHSRCLFTSPMLQYASAMLSRC